MINVGDKVLFFDKNSCSVKIAQIVKKNRKKAKVSLINDNKVISVCYDDLYKTENDFDKLKDVVTKIFKDRVTAVDDQYSFIMDHIKVLIRIIN